MLKLMGRIYFTMENCVYLNLCFNLANSADPDEMSSCVTFHRVFTVCQSTCIPVCRMKRVNGKMYVTYLLEFQTEIS